MARAVKGFYLLNMSAWLSLVALSSEVSAVARSRGKLCFVVTSIVVLLCGCSSAEDKARIRLAVSAFKLAADARERDESLMADLQRAIDVVPDGRARDELVSCRGVLTEYWIAQQRIVLSFEDNLQKIGHGRETTAKEAEIAMSKAKRDNPALDPKPMVDCEALRLPKLTE